MILLLSFLLDGAPVPPFPLEGAGAPPADPIFITVLFFTCVAGFLGLAFAMARDRYREDELRYLKESARREMEIERLIDAAGRKPWQ